MTETIEKDDERFVRQRYFVPRDRMMEQHITIIGCGATGRNVAEMAACMGVPKIDLWDRDDIEPPNIGTQGFHTSQIGMSKVEAVAELVRSIYPECEVTAHDRYWADDCELGNAIFSCADSMSCRKDVWEAMNFLPHTQFLADSRITGEAIRIVCAKRKNKGYEKCLFDDADAAEATCGKIGLITVSKIAAANLLQQFTLFLRDEPWECDMLMNMRAQMYTKHSDTVLGES